MPAYSLPRFVLLVLVLGATALPPSPAAAQKAEQEPEQRAFLTIAFEGPALFTPTALDVAEDGTLTVAAIESGEPGPATELRVGRFDATGRRIWERNPAPRAEFATTVIARAGMADTTLVLHDETPGEVPQLAVIKLDARGRVLWRRPLGPGAASDLLPLSDGTVMIAGSNKGSRPNEIDALVMRLGEDGKPLWRQAFVGQRKDAGNSADILRRLADGAIAVGGLTDIVLSGDEQASASRGWIFALDGNGQQRWQQPLAEGGELSVLAGLTIAEDGALFGLVAAETQPGGGQRYTLVKISPTGDIAWQRPIADYPDQEVNDLVALPDGTLVLAGSEPAGDVRAAFLAALDGEGKERWRVNYRGYKLRRAVAARPHPQGGIAVLFEGPAGSGYDTTAYLGLLGSNGRF